MKNIVLSIIVSFASGLLGAYTYHQWLLQMPKDELKPKWTHYKSNSELATFRDTANSLILVEDDFAEASARSTQSVVYIKTVSENEYKGSSWFDLFFEGRTNQQVSSGSGVIYSRDGYIVTNNHVIDKAIRLEVIHNKKTYQAKVIGTDPSTDLAVLKVESSALPAITLGNSRELKVGEWVLAVGNPFNLTSTVTAGIVSAKGREINILKSKFPIESFIQTDAAINPGNSGGALVDRNGHLVGINTAILSKTGSYAGYGFAVPADIVRKVVDDIIDYGEVQKAFLGAEVVDVSAELAQQLHLSSLEGVIISYLQKDGAAENAGLKKGDVIISVDDEVVRSRSEFEELISYRSPGDFIKIAISRNQKIQQAKLQLTNREGNTELLVREVYDSDFLGAMLESISSAEADLLKIEQGVKVGKLRNGLLSKLGIDEGFIVTAINQRPIVSPEELEEILSKIQGRVRIEGINKRGIRGYYSFVF